MRVFLGLLVSVIFFPQASEKPNDLDRIQGTWVMVSMEREGDEVPSEDFKGSTVVYEKDRVSLREGTSVRRRGIITLNPGRKPKAINTWDQDGPYEDQTVPGIYELEGDTLRLAFSRPGQERPIKFSTKEGGAVLYCVYKRQKP